MSHIKWIAVSGFLVAVVSTGCQTNTRKENGALIGSGLGAAAGAIIGNQVGERDKGALIGGAIGAVTGGIAGDAADKEEQRQNAVTYAQHQEAMRRADQRAMTNEDVLKMASQGIKEGIILDTIRDRGGRFDLSPDSVTALATRGVSQDVIREMRQNNINAY
ncbi:MAG: hypothetical protein CMJ78_17075 [Planctomycetaceae bacterium]|nr:hypothetical protein [Planctomycetaceae bacterium]